MDQEATLACASRAQEPTQVTSKKAEAFLTKSCPRCLEELFDDMSVCYGCLYDFSRAQNPKDDCLVEDTSLDTHIDDAHVGGAYVERSSSGKLSCDDTCDISFDMEHAYNEPQVSASNHELCGRDEQALYASSCRSIDSPHSEGTCVAEMHVQSPSADFKINFAQELVIGRARSCDVCLHSRAVSRKHIRFFKEHNAYYVEDLHAINQARINGRYIDRKIELLSGDCVEVCGTRFTFVVR